jgi:hypothetical protein
MGNNTKQFNILGTLVITMKMLDFVLKQTVCETFQTCIIYTAVHIYHINFNSKI